MFPQPPRNAVVVLRIGAGNFDVGFPITLQIFENGQLIKEEKDWFRIPAAPEIPQFYKNWRDKYHVLGRAIQPIQGQTTNSSTLKTCQAAARELEDYMRRWFEDIHFASLRDRIRVEAQVRADESVAIILDCNTGIANQDLQLRKLPWHLWDLFSSHLPNAEVALNAGFNRPVEPLGRPVKILAIFGSSKGGLKLEEDITALKALQQRGAEITFELQPNREVLHQRLSKQAWDILFFAGHSSSEAANRRGYLEIGDDRSLSLDDLREDLKKAVAKNLKLAVFNSCDGLGIADYLADLKVPITIAMREPVPDLVARKFLRYFLEEFSSGKPLYQAVREARSSLHWMESDDENPCPAATWLPVICQNPNQPELVWSASDGVTPVAIDQVEQPTNLKLLGDLANLYSRKTLEVGKENAVGMVMAVSWHIDADPTSKFPQSSKQLWKADVNYATAMSYDAAQALAEALKRNPTRTGIQQALRNRNFSAPGAADPVQFSSSGDRRSQIQLIEIQKVTRSRSGTGFDFVPIPSQDAS